MPYLNSNTSTDKNLQIFYEDLGNGQPLVFVHGWPLTHQMWEYQLTPFRESGFRCIAYDRRGFGKSDQSLNSYSYDALAEDLHNLIEHLNLRDAILIGFSMGGGEVVRYCSKYGTSCISKIVLISSVVPYMLETEDNPEGVPLEMFREFDKQIRNDRPGFLASFGKQFYGVGFLNHPVSDGILNWTNSLAFPASQKATLACVESFSQTDFRQELNTINIPALIIHGDDDKTVPIKATSEKAATLIPNALYKVYSGAPHGLFYTHKTALNLDISSFILNGTVSKNPSLPEGMVVLPSNDEGVVTRV